MTSPPVVLNHLLPLEAVRLGRLVSNIKDPVSSFHQSDTIPQDISIQRLEEFSQVLSQVKGSRLHGFLTAAFSGTFETQTNSTSRIESSTCITRQLENSDGYFSRLCGTLEARDWLERAMRRRQGVFMVVGIKTLTDARITQVEQRLREVSLDVQVPVMAVVGATTGVVLPLGEVLDPGVGQARTTSVIAGMGFVAPGEQVYAVQYRKVEFSWFRSSQKIDQSRLEGGNAWKVYVGPRGSGVDGEEEEDSVEVNLGSVERDEFVDEVGGLQTCEDEDGRALYYFQDYSGRR